MIRTIRKPGVTISTTFKADRVLYTLTGEMQRVDKEVDDILRRYPPERFGTCFMTAGFNLDKDVTIVSKTGERLIVAREEM
jgi:hypothetical protein